MCAKNALVRYYSHWRFSVDTAAFHCRKKTDLEPYQNRSKYEVNTTFDRLYSYLLRFKFYDCIISARKAKMVNTAFTLIHLSPDSNLVLHVIWSNCSLLLTPFQFHNILLFSFVELLFYTEYWCFLQSIEIIRRNEIPKQSQWFLTVVSLHSVFLEWTNGWILLVTWVWMNQVTCQNIVW